MIFLEIQFVYVVEPVQKYSYDIKSKDKTWGEFKLIGSKQEEILLNFHKL